MSTPFEETKSTKPGVFIKTFGCQMNEYDSQKMLTLLEGTHVPVDSEDQAEVVIVNTCSVREKGEHKLFSLLGRLRDLKKEKENLVIGVSGCVAQQEGQSIIKRNSAVDFVVGTHNLSLVPSLVKGVREGRSAQVAIDYRDEWESLPKDFDAVPRSVQEAKSTFSITNTPIRALVAIQRGCNKKCAFCVVPTTRGPEVSRPADEILREVKTKIRLGAKEVMLIGQTVNSYGRDLTPRYPFERLIRDLAEVEGLERIRFTSPHPQDVRPEFLDLFSDVPQLCPHIHLPLQSGSDRILKLMNRNYRMKRYYEIVDSLKSRCPEITISSDFIVGFPTETDADFEATLDAMKKVRYNASYSFKYSIRPNTVAKDNFVSDQEVGEEVAKARLKQLQELQEELSLEYNRAQVGRELEVLVEASSTNKSELLRGRTPQNTLVEIEGLNFNVGDTVRVKIEHVGAYGLRGKAVNG